MTADQDRRAVRAVTDSVSAPFVLALHHLLERHHAEALLPALLTVVQPHLADEPQDGAGWMDGALVRRIVQVLDHSRQLDLLLPVLDVAGPYLVQPAMAAPVEVVMVQPAEGTLSVREQQILVEVAKGRSNAAAGRRLHMAENTVKSHLTRIFHKLAAHDRAHAVARGYELGYLIAPEPAGEAA